MKPNETKMKPSETNKIKMKHVTKWNKNKT
jgi:hypothetical protein